MTTILALPLSLFISAFSLLSADDRTWRSTPIQWSEEEVQIPGPHPLDLKEPVKVGTTILERQTIRFIDVNASGYVDDRYVDMIFVDRPRGMIPYMGRLQLKKRLIELRISFDGKKLQYREVEVDPKLRSFEPSLTRLNLLRAAVGVAPVALDTDLSRATQSHATYMTKNPTHQRHLELKTANGYTAEGDEAARHSLLHYEQRGFLPAIDSWNRTFYHRIPMHHPYLDRVGMGFDAGNCVFNERTLFTKRPPFEFPPLPIPAPEQTDVPTTFNEAGETPSPIPDISFRGIGFPITLTFAPQAVIDNVRVEVSAKGDPIQGFLSYPGEGAFREDRPKNEDSICFLPRAPLPAATWIQVVIHATVDGEAFVQSWRFRTE